MVDLLPITLVGDTLGERHRHLNNLVNNAQHENGQLQLILDLPEVNPLDRVFKIKLASKHKHVNFIIDNLKSKDMLYVSLALNNVWLLEYEYRYIINPEYLEQHVYPEMITTAVTKMKNFIELNLKTPERCQEFYEYYKSNFDIAIKFLWHCSKEFITAEVLKIMDKLTPKHLRILCETCPQVASLYFEGLQSNKAALLSYTKDENKYFTSISNVLKVDGNLFLDVIEKYFNKSSMSPLSSSATRYIMRNFKDRYLAKPELYAAWLLHVKTLARFLTAEEIKDIVVKLARAQYLNSTFTYKEAEPFIKCLSAEERASIKKQVFIDKSIGDMIKTWPYPAPKSLQLDSESNFEPFKDIEHDPYEYECLEDHDFDGIFRSKKKLKKRRCDMLGMTKMCCYSASMPLKTNLDQLFERYRFMNFDRTFFELRKLLLAEGTIEGRRNMMLVLVSKSGGHTEKLEQLLKFLVERHSNEPVHLRDAIARSLVKRAFVWRLPCEIWDLLMKWTTTSVSEILHSSILRHLLADSQVPQENLAAYLEDFCDLTMYSLSVAEKACIAKRLPALLIRADAPGPLLKTLEAYKLRVYDTPGAVDLLILSARKDENILRRLFKSKVARKHLLKESFTIIQTDAAYVNALRHDPSVLENGECFASLVTKEKPNHDRFLRALALYFSEPDGLAVRHRIALEKSINEECGESFARPLAFLFHLGNEPFKNYIERVKFKTLVGFQRKLAAAIRANGFVIRPVLDLDVINWQLMGAKFICNSVLLSSDRDVEANIKKCLIWKKTIRTALRLAPRSKLASEVFAAAVKMRPILALKIVLSDIRKSTVDIGLWNQVKPVISSLDLSKNSLRYIKKSLGDLYLPSNIETDYWTTVYGAFYRASELDAMPMLCKIENLLPEVHEDLVTQIILDFFSKKLNKDVFPTYNSTILCLYFRIIAKYLIASENDHIQKVKKETVCDPFFDKIETLLREIEDDSKIVKCLDDFLFGLKYSKAFLNTKYVSCIPMFENILERLRKIFPRERYFEKYVCIHLTMLYYRSIRQAMKQKPEIFSDPILTRKEGIKLVGVTMGKYVGIEIQDLVQSCFNSIIEVYQRGFVKFVTDYFEYDNHRATLVMSMIRGLIEGGEESQLLAQYVFEKEHSGYVKDQERDEILKLLKDVNTEQMKFFLYAHINPY